MSKFFEAGIFGPKATQKFAKIRAAADRMFSSIGKKADGLKGKFKGITEVLQSIAFQSQVTFGIMAAGLQKAIGLANPQAITRFQWAMADLGAVIGQTLLPAMEKATRQIRALADWYLNLSDKTKNVIAAVAGLTGGVVAFNAIAPVAIGLVTGLAGAFKVLYASMGPIGIIASALGAIFAATAHGGGALSKVFDGIKSALAPLWPGLAALGEAIGDFFGAIGEILAPVMEAVGSIVRLLAPAFARLGFVLKVAAVPFKFFAGVLRGAVEIFRWFADAIESVVNKLDELYNGFARAIKTVTLGLVDIGTEVRLTKDLFKFEDLFGKKSSVGAAAGRASFTDIAGVGRQATINALQAGKNDPAKRTADATEATQKDISALRKIVDKMEVHLLGQGFTQTFRQAAQSALLNAPQP